ncbi:SURF1 family protein [Marinivivus vitaminiproducens]|uniref:SURF1 family protein n=1 Tax=Marinivivus vitaminiproducens TaxID=3035935 RepID=UPI0027A57C08|nr:SURF1 family protein [Geminicoccaceae bacterium SCSIO 64248]
MTPARSADRRPARPGLLLSLASFAVLIVLLGLGTWQVRRLQWKEDLIAHRAAQIEAAPVAFPDAIEDPQGWDFRRVSARGRFLHEREQAMGAIARAGAIGAYLLTPLQLDDGRVLLVDRGWRPDKGDAPLDRPAGEVAVEGVLRDRGADRPGWMTPDNRPERGAWYWYDMAGLRRATGLDLLPVVLEASAPVNAGGSLPRAHPTQVELPNNHLQYAITWYGLAAALVAVFIAFGFRRRETSS